MSSIDIIQQRLVNQRIYATSLKHAAEVVDWLGAVQAQDFAGAKWALGLRAQAATDAGIERLFNAGEILRTHLLRPTWHFVTPADIRWMLALTAPQVHQRNAYMYRKSGLDSADFKLINAVLLKALQGGVQLARDELRLVFQEAGLNPGGGPGGEYRLSYILMQAELEGVVCSGSRRGKQFTYALLDERAPAGKTLDREGALAELARRYFTSRGPATVHDFSKWSGLSVSDARHGLEAVKAGLEQEILDGKPYWFPHFEGPPGHGYPQAYLLSIYDEYISSYKGLDTVASAENASRLVGMGNALTSIILIDGRIAGTWKRELRKDAVRITVQLYRGLSEAERQTLTSAAYSYGEFVELPVVMV